MTIMNQVILLIVLTRIVETLANMKCSSTTSTTIPKYHLIEKCHQSKLGIAARANFTSLTSCKRLGIEKRALALNFSPQNANRSKPLHYSCEALKCAESEGGLSLNNDTRYDYYSIYANPLPNINSTCVPTAGMFVILPKKFNYTESQKHCKNISAVLADITDEHRTDALAQALATAGAEAAYVGMRRNSNRIFFLSESGGSLDCITYRAWAPGHPQRNTNMSCVILTKYHTWKTVACKDKYQVLCELIPRGPYKKGSIFSLKNLNI